MSQHNNYWTVRATVSGRLADALDELAVDMKTDPQGALGALLEIMLDNGAGRAREALGVMPRAIQSEAVS
jgi:hypothetical protein